MFENGTLTEHSGSYIWQEQSIKKHIFNAYYNGKVGQLGIDLNIDGLFDDTKTPGRTTETTTPVQSVAVAQQHTHNAPSRTIPTAAITSGPRSSSSPIPY
ncbi:MAG: hypothetical protein VZQ78_09250, partial [Prevotella sp.]|nr:hypothetical protein [Prevotella sp.]